MQPYFILALIWKTTLFAFVRRLGWLGLFTLSILDSSFLFLPFGNDVLLIALVSSRRDSPIWIVYVLLSAVGSVIGVCLIDVIMRKMGEEGLSRFVKPEKVKQLGRRMEKGAAWVIFLATILPPPFPFTAVVLTASALQTPRKQILIPVFVGRLARFTVEAVLALYFGRQVLRVLASDAIEYAVYIFLGVALFGSALSIRKWLGGQQETRYNSKNTMDVSER